MRVARLMDEPDWQSRLSPIEEIFFATSPSAKTLRPDEHQPFKERWLGRYIAYDIESFFVFATFFFVRELDFLPCRDVGGSKFKLKLSSIAGGACGGRLIARSGGRA
jgi:hypothetical protein